MNELQKKQLAEAILQTLEGERFAQWDKTTFSDFITGDLMHEKKITYDEARALILKDIERLFALSFAVLIQNK
jgi:hypothetical protein